VSAPTASLSVGSRLAAVHDRIVGACARARRDPAGVTLIAMTKGFPAQAINEAVAAGISEIGENYLQEAREKLAGHPQRSALRTHFCGHLQSNKAADVLGLFDVIHTLDSDRLVSAIERHAGPHKVQVFLQVNLAGIEGRSGVAVAELPALVERATASTAVEVIGLMTLPPKTATTEEARPWFRRLRTIAAKHHLEHLSMGMSEDYEVAIEEGATYVRIGRAIFGERS